MYYGMTDEECDYGGTKSIWFYNDKNKKIRGKRYKFMLEWMHDYETLSIFQTILSVDENTAKQFINNSFSNVEQHFAIVDDDDDEYLGTISLKILMKTKMQSMLLVQEKEGEKELTPWQQT